MTMTLHAPDRLPDASPVPSIVDPPVGADGPCLIALDPAAQDPSALLSAAGRFAGAMGARGVLLGVVRPQSLGGAAGPSPAEAQARAALDVAAAELRRQGVEAAPLLRAGPLVSTVADTAARHRVGLVVLGAPRRRPGFRSWLGAGPRAALAGRLPCPTLYVGGDVASARADGATAGPGGVRRFDADVARAGPAVPHPLGTRTVEVARIVGSVGRANDVDGRFQQRSDGARSDKRHGRLVDAVEGGAALPPVDLYRLGYGYYLLDGHRRVAAARTVGQLWIDATVVEFVPVADGAARRALGARRAFEQASGVTQIEAALPETYPRLERLVREFAERERIGDLCEAGARWYARVFRPARTRLRAGRAHEDFPGYRTADIVARLSGA